MPESLECRLILSGAWRFWGKRPFQAIKVQHILAILFQSSYNYSVLEVESKLVLGRKG